MSRPIRIAIVGCGRVAQHYKYIFDSGCVSGWNIVGVCDVIKSRSDEFADHFQTLSFEDYHAMLENVTADLILVLTPSGYHYEHTKIALEKGISVLVEKPIAMLPSQGNELVELARQRRIMYGVAFQNRLNPAISCLREAIKLKRFGHIVTATIRLRWCRYQKYYEDGWHGTWAHDGGVINQQAIHHLDALNWLMGPVDSVCATMTNRLNQLEAEDTMVAIVKFSSGALGTIEATTAARPEDFEASLSVVGEKGLVLIGGVALNKIETWHFLDRKPDDDEIPLRYSLEVPNGYGLSHATLLQSTLAALRMEKLHPPVPAEQAVKTTELVHALYRSAEVGGWVSLSDKPVSAKLGSSKLGV
jgi:UDP-N-acetyl-2-amino-2-deoxyglucuronate dehydrogenase